MNDQRNLVLAFALSIGVLLGWQFLLPTQEGRHEKVVQLESPAPEISHEANPAQPASSTSSIKQPFPQAESGKGRTDELPAKDKKPTGAQLISWGNDVLTLGIDPDSGAIRKAGLLKYSLSAKAGSGPVLVLNREETHSMYLGMGLLKESGKVIFKEVNRDAGSLLLRADLSGNRVWTRRLSIKQGSYLVDIEDEIKGGEKPRLYRQVLETSPDLKKDTFYEHNGPISFLNGKLKEVDYKALKEGKSERLDAIGGWTGIMNRYFITAIIPDQSQTFHYYYQSPDGNIFQAGLIDDGVQKGGMAAYHSKLYIGPKSIPVMKTIGVNLERSVNFGWFTVIAKPMHDFLMLLYSYLNNFGFCIILVVIFLKILFFWPSKKSYESMAGMRKIQPEVKRVRELYGDDKQKMGQEMMALYKKHKVNPLGGCLPIFIQIPVFFSLYKVLLISIEMRQAPFIGWIHDLSVQDPFYVLPVIMGISMLVQQQLNPTPPDPMQAKLMKFLPIVFTAMFLFFPAGLVLYWVMNNILSILQQWYVMKQQDAI